MPANEALRRARLSSYDYFQRKRWEGKPLKFQIKYALANYPAFVAGAVGFFIAGCLATYRFCTYKGSKREALKKYKTFYTVKRDDDPDLERIIAEREYGRHFFPKY